MEEIGASKFEKQLQVVPKTQEAAEYHQKTYLVKVAPRLDGIDQLPLAIMLCGPGLASSHPLVGKRKQAVNELRKLAFDASLGEELVDELKSNDFKNGHPIKPDSVYEGIIADSVDLVIIFLENPGAIGESYEFLSKATIREHTKVFIDDKYTEGYVIKGNINIFEDNAEYYKSPEDIEQCKLVTRVIEKAQKRRYMKYLWG